MQFHVNCVDYSSAHQQFSEWKELGRYVKRGERALTLCMPLMRKRTTEDKRDDETESAETYTTFSYKARWFVLTQTDGEELIPLPTPGWNPEQALTNLHIERIAIDLTDGNVRGFA